MFSSNSILSLLALTLYLIPITYFDQVTNFIFQGRQEISGNNGRHQDIKKKKKRGKCFMLMFMLLNLENINKKYICILVFIEMCLKLVFGLHINKQEV